MARATILFGLALCAATVVGLLTANTERIMTVFVPMIFGIPIFICGVISLNPHRRRFWVRCAIAVATIGAICSMARVVAIAMRRIEGDPTHPIAVWIATGLTVALITYAMLVNRALRKRKGEAVIAEGENQSERPVGGS